MPLYIYFYLARGRTNAWKKHKAVSGQLLNAPEKAEFIVSDN